MGQTFIFIRHGNIPIQAEASGRLPPLKKRGLSPTGEQQARAAGVFLRRWLTAQALTVDRLVHPGSRRALQTAALALDPLPPAKKQWMNYDTLAAK